MVDNRSTESRSALMSRVGSKDTAPEMTVRRLLHAMGYRFRLHRRDLPGTPDIVFPRHRKAIFVHGCFWHAHGCRIGKPPKSRPEYWGPKLARNLARDAEKETALKAAGWQVLTLWQCEVKEWEALGERLKTFLR
jgi:DNA mismatch endonuclease (patch repair protein)